MVIVVVFLPLVCKRNDCLGTACKAMPNRASDNPTPYQGDVSKRLMWCWCAANSAFMACSLEILTYRSPREAPPMPNTVTFMLALTDRVAVCLGETGEGLGRWEVCRARLIKRTAAIAGNMARNVGGRECL